MFTGLIEEIGGVSDVKKVSDGIYITVKASLVLEDVSIGDSIAINGACQTVTSLSSESFTVFASRVTEEITNLGLMKKGFKVNLERAMSHESRFGGHIVQGHVDGTGIVSKVNRDQNGIEIYIDASPQLLKYIVAKGSVAVDGISLTVVSIDEKGFILYLIPETLNKTSIKNWRIGTVVNIETDILAKYVEKMLNNRNNDSEEKDINLRKKLMEEGYI